MALSVLVVLLLTVLYEVLKVWRARLGSGFEPPPPPPPQPRSPSQGSYGSDCNSMLDGSPSESSLCPFQPQRSASSSSSRWAESIEQQLLLMFPSGLMRHFNDNETIRLFNCTSN